jgi:hypothetical protein
MSDTFMASLQQEDTDPFANVGTEKENTDASPAETKPEVDEPNEGETTKEPVVNTQEEDEPFHRRWKVREEKLKNELEEKFQSDLENYKREVEQKLPQGKQTAPQFLTDMVGENEQVAKNFSQYEQQLKESVKREIFEEQERARVAAQKDEQKWNSWIDSEVEKLADEGHTFDRNELLKTVLDYRPTDENNNYDFKAALKILQLQKPVVDNSKKTAARKAIADTTVSSPQGESEPKQYMTAKDLRHKGWNSL